MTKLKIILAASIAATAFSCSNGDDNSGGSSTEVYTFTLKNKTSDSFTLVEEYEYEDCTDGGILKTETDTDETTINYSINNNILVWQNRWSDDTLNFKGTSNNLTGTWTRTKNRDASCELRHERYEEGEEDIYYECKDDWRLTKVVFSGNTVKVTQDYCRTETLVESTNSRGWKSKPISCDTYEYSKGSDKVTYTRTRTSRSYTYNGKTCTRSQQSKSKREAACKEAWNKYHQTEEYWMDFISEFLYKDYNDCMKKLNLPSDF